MLNNKKLLTKILKRISTDSIEIPFANNSWAGGLAYVQIGPVVVVNGSLNVPSQMSAGTLLAYDMPSPMSAIIGGIDINSSTGVYGNCYINADNTLRNAGTWATGWHRFSLVYITALGGVIRQLLSTLTISERGWCCA